MSIDIEPRTTPARATATPSADAPAAPAELPRLPARRDPRWIALGVVALCLGALLSYVVYARVAAESVVVAAAHTVYRGEVVTRDDLTTLRLRGGALPDTVAAADLDALVGRRAAYDLPQGSVVPAAAVAGTELPADGRAAVGLKLATGRAPATLLLPSSPVRLVALPPGADGSKDALAGKTYPARVISTTPGADGASTDVEVEVDAAQAPTVALLAAQDRVAVVRDAGS